MSSPYSFLLQIKAITLALIVCIAFYAVDNCVEEKSFFRNIEDYLQFMTLIYVGVIAFFYDDIRPGFKQLITAIASVALMVYTLKYLINAKRPSGGGYSFPSGHTSFAFAIATMIHKRYNFYYAVPAYINGALVGYLRVFHGKHHIQDVVCGAIIAIMLTWKIVSHKNAKII